MKAFKTYREQNPGKTYFDFKAYADGGITDQRTDHPIGKPKLPDPKMIRQDRLIDLGGSPAEDITYEERYKRGKRERTQQDWKSLLHGINSTFGTAASLASFIYGGGWSLTRLLNGNKSSTIGQQLSKYVLPSNTIDTAADIAAFVEEPNTETGTEIVGGILLGKERDFSKVSRQAAELVQQVQNINNTFADGGEIPPSNKPIIPEEPQPYKGKLYKDRYGRKYTEEQVYDYYNNGTDEIDRFTGGPLVRGLKPLLDLEDAANFTPVGDAVAAYDVYDAVSNKDWSGAGLAALGLVPFVPNIGEAVFKSSKKLSKSKNYIPKVNPNYKQSVIDRALREESTFNKIPNNVTEEIIDQRNRTYELMQEPYARNRAKEVDAQYGTDYLKVYDSMLDKYVNIDEYFKLPDPQYKKMERPTIAAQVTPAKGNTMYFNRDMIKAPEDIPSNVVLHEMGHLVDGAAGMNNEFLKKLGDKSKFIPFNQAKLMYPTMTKEGYNNILQGTEIKSYMNQFRNYLNQNGKLHNGNYTGSYKGLKKEIIEAPKESFNNIKAIFNLYRSPKLFNKDFQMIPIVNNKDNRDIS